MESKQQTSKDYFKTLLIIFYALISGQVFFGLIALFVSKDMENNTLDTGLIKILTYIFPAILLAGYLSSQYIFKNSLKTAINRESLAEKMNNYRSALIIRFALLEGPSFLSIVVFLMTGEVVFVGYAAIVIVLFLTMIPSVERAVTDLQLNPNEEQKVRNPDDMIA